MNAKSERLPDQKGDIRNTQPLILHPESVLCRATRAFGVRSASTKKALISGATSILAQQKARAKRPTEQKTTSLSFESLTDSESVAILLYRDICAYRDRQPCPHAAFPDELLLFAAFPVAPPGSRTEGGPLGKRSKRRRTATPCQASSPALLQVFLQTSLLPVERVREDSHGAAVSIARWVAEHCYGCPGPRGRSDCDKERERGRAAPLMPRELLAEVVVLLARRGCLCAATAPTWLSTILFEIQKQMGAVAAAALRDEGGGSAKPTALPAAWQAEWGGTIFMNRSQSVAWLSWRLSEDIVRTVYALQALCMDVGGARGDGEGITNSVSSLTSAAAKIGHTSFQPSSWSFFSFHFLMHALGIALHELGLLCDGGAASLSLLVVPNMEAAGKKLSEEAWVAQGTSNLEGTAAPSTGRVLALEAKIHNGPCSSYWVDILFRTCFLIKQHEGFPLPFTSSQESTSSLLSKGGCEKSELLSKGKPNLSQQLVDESEGDKQIRILFEHKWSKFTKMVCSNIAKLRARDVCTAILIDALLT